MLLSELMSCSLHDLLQVQRLSLDVPEMLDVLGDVLQGVAYLHAQDPPIMHGNLTSKNVLFQGNIAKVRVYICMYIHVYTSESEPVLHTH